MSGFQGKHAALILVLRPLDTKACSAGQQRKDKDGTAHSMWQLVQLPPNGRHGGTAVQCTSALLLAWGWLNHKKCVTCSVLRFVPINGLHVMTFVGAGNGLFGSKTTVVQYSSTVVWYSTVRAVPSKYSVSYWSRCPPHELRTKQNVFYAAQQQKDALLRRQALCKPSTTADKTSGTHCVCGEQGKTWRAGGRKGAERAAP